MQEEERARGVCVREWVRVIVASECRATKRVRSSKCVLVFVYVCLHSRILVRNVGGVDVCGACVFACILDACTFDVSVQRHVRQLCERLRAVHVRMITRTRVKYDSRHAI